MDPTRYNYQIYTLESTQFPKKLIVEVIKGQVTQINDYQKEVFSTHGIQIPPKQQTLYGKSRVAYGDPLFPIALHDIYYRSSMNDCRLVELPSQEAEEFLDV